MESKSGAFSSKEIIVVDRVPIKEGMAKRERYLTTIVLMYAHFAFVS
jgi:hypothetical protein